MKITLLTAAILTLVGIATTPAKATDNDAAVSNETSPTSPTNSAATSKTSADTETITTYVVHYGGAGWGLARKARLAIQTQDGVHHILLSGLRATVVMEEGKKLDKTKTAEALKAKGLPLTSFQKSETPIPAVTYQLKVSGTGWATTNEKVRAALEKIEGIHGAYVNNGISLHLASKGAYDQEKIAKELKVFKLTIKESKPLDGSPFVKPAKKK